MTSRSKTFICYWDINGFEVIKDLTSWERLCLVNSIAGTPLPNPPISLKMLTLRAQFNPQRNPEIWTFNTDDEMDEDLLWGYANENPQALADLIRAKGSKIFGHRYVEPTIK